MRAGVKKQHQSGSAGRENDSDSDSLQTHQDTHTQNYRRVCVCGVGERIRDEHWLCPAFVWIPVRRDDSRFLSCIDDSLTRLDDLGKPLKRGQLLFNSFHRRPRVQFRVQRVSTCTGRALETKRGKKKKNYSSTVRFHEMSNQSTS